MNVQLNQKQINSGNALGNLTSTVSDIRQYAEAFANFLQAKADRAEEIALAMTSAIEAGGYRAVKDGVEDDDPDVLPAIPMSILSSYILDPDGNVISVASALTSALPNARLDGTALPTVASDTVPELQELIDEADEAYVRIVDGSQYTVQQIMDYNAESIVANAVNVEVIRALTDSVDLIPTISEGDVLQRINAKFAGSVQSLHNSQETLAIARDLRSGLGEKLQSIAAIYTRHADACKVVEVEGTSIAKIEFDTAKAGSFTGASPMAACFSAIFNQDLGDSFKTAIKAVINIIKGIFNDVIMPLFQGMLSAVKGFFTREAIGINGGAKRPTWGYPLSPKLKQDLEPGGVNFDLTIPFMKAAAAYTAHRSPESLLAHIYDWMPQEAMFFDLKFADLYVYKEGPEGYKASQIVDGYSIPNVMKGTWMWPGYASGWTGIKEDTAFSTPAVYRRINASKLKEWYQWSETPISGDYLRIPLNIDRFYCNEWDDSYDFSIGLDEHMVFGVRYYFSIPATEFAISQDAVTKYLTILKKSWVVLDPELQNPELIVQFDDGVVKRYRPKQRMQYLGSVDTMRDRIWTATATTDIRLTFGGAYVYDFGADYCLGVDSHLNRFKPGELVDYVTFGDSDPTDEIPPEWDPSNKQFNFSFVDFTPEGNVTKAEVAIRYMLYLKPCITTGLLPLKTTTKRGWFNFAGEWQELPGFSHEGTDSWPGSIYQEIMDSQFIKAHPDLAAKIEAEADKSIYHVYPEGVNGDVDYIRYRKLTGEFGSIIDQARSCMLPFQFSVPVEGEANLYHLINQYTMVSREVVDDLDEHRSDGLNTVAEAVHSWCNTVDINPANPDSKAEIVMGIANALLLARQCFSTSNLLLAEVLNPNGFSGTDAPHESLRFEIPHLNWSTRGDQCVVDEDFGIWVNSISEFDIPSLYGMAYALTMDPDFSLSNKDLAAACLKDGSFDKANNWVIMDPAQVDPSFGSIIRSYVFGILLRSYLCSSEGMRVFNGPTSMLDGLFIPYELSNGAPDFKYFIVDDEVNALKGMAAIALIAALIVGVGIGVGKITKKKRLKKKKLKLEQDQQRNCAETWNLMSDTQVQEDKKAKAAVDKELADLKKKMKAKDYEPTEQDKEKLTALMTQSTEIDDKLKSNAKKAEALLKKDAKLQKKIARTDKKLAKFGIVDKTFVPDEAITSANRAADTEDTQQNQQDDIATRVSTLEESVQNIINRIG